MWEEFADFSGGKLRLRMRWRSRCHSRAPHQAAPPRCHLHSAPSPRPPPRCLQGAYSLDMPPSSIKLHADSRPKTKCTQSISWPCSLMAMTTSEPKVREEWRR